MGCLWWRKFSHLEKPARYLPQDFFYWWYYSWKSDLGCWTHTRWKWNIWNFTQVNALHLVRDQQLGLDTVIVNYQFHFSGGERQRWHLLECFWETKIIVTWWGHFSTGSRKRITNYGLSSKPKTEVTIIFVTHRKSLKPFFDKIINLG
jgi:ABC-type bacteriocin/lantibiotic exporter with double-glycine peptidase domain